MPNKPNKEMEAVKVDIATVKAEKLGWWRAAIAMSAVVATMFSSLVFVTVHLDDKIDKSHDSLMTEITEIKINQAVSDERQILMQKTLGEILFIIRQSADPETLNAINDVLKDTSIDTLSTAPATSTTISYSLETAGEALLVAPGDSLGNFPIEIAINTYYNNPY